MAPATGSELVEQLDDSPRGLSNAALQQACDRLFLLGLLAAVLFVLWLPVIPTGDGPMHLYYADVLWSLVRHQPAYAQDYAIRHLFAPYLVHYLALVSFEQFVLPAMAEKLFVAVIFLTQAFGFRFLARRLGGQASLVCIWMLPLLFSWSLGGGFLNCCFASGVALWSFGVWTMLGETPSGGRLTVRLFVFASLLTVLVLSHPVPLLVLLLFTASDLLLQVLAQPAKLMRQSLVLQAAAFTMTCAAFLAPVLLAQKGQAAAVLPGMGFHADVLRELVSGMRLGLFAGLNVHTVSGWLALFARAGLLVIVPGVIWLLIGLRQETAPKWPSAAQAILSFLTTPAKRLLLISVVFLAATIFFPRSLNNSYFFPQRMWDIVWLLVLACAAAATPPAHVSKWLTACGLALMVLTAVTGLPALARIARAQQQLAAAPLPAGERGLFLEPASAEEGRGAATTYPVYSWSGARAFAASHAILLNSPWLGLTILPVRDAIGSGAQRRAPLLDKGLPSIYSESPLLLTHTLATQSDDRNAILARTDFFLYSNPASIGSPNATAETERAALALLGAESAAWHCEGRDFYAVCLRAR